MKTDIFEGRPPFRLRDPRLDPVRGDVLCIGREVSVVAVVDSTMPLSRITYDTTVDREHSRGALTLAAFRETFRAAEVLHVAGYAP
jgi:hypothetical protein